MTKFKKLSKTRSISIPKDLAAHLDLGEGSKVDLTAAENGTIVISRHIDTCRFCGGADKVKRFKDIFVCPVCAEALCSEVCRNE